jgi:hypothetical protein
MDSLALLCNLYGDGPATLRRLRESGLASLEAIAVSEAERLAGVLRTSVRSARRFQLEGRLLIDRTAPGDPPVAREATAPPEPQRGDPLLKKVLETWRRLDDEASTPPSAPEVVSSAPATPSAPRPPAMDLQEAAIDGLDPAHRERLAHSGVVTLEDLTACDALRIASAEGIALTRMLHWQLLGRRALASARQVSLANAPPEAIETTEHGVLRPVPPLMGARSRASAVQAAPIERTDPAGPLQDALAGLRPTSRFSPAESPPYEAEIPSELDLHAGHRAPVEPGPSPADALDSAGPFA